VDLVSSFLMEQEYQDVLNASSLLYYCRCGIQGDWLRSHIDDKYTDHQLPLFDQLNKHYIRRRHRLERSPHRWGRGT